jgi:CBS domain-containing protein
MILFIAAVLYSGATSEEHAVRTRSNIRNLKAGHLLPQEPHTIEPDTTLGEIVPLLLSHGQTHFPVVKGGRLAGVLCHRDIVAGLKRDGGDELAAKELMRPPLLVAPEDSLAEIQHRMETQGITVACIVRAGKLVGLVSYDSLRRLAGLLDSNGG